MFLLAMDDEFIVYPNTINPAMGRRNRRAKALAWNRTSRLPNPAGVCTPSVGVSNPGLTKAPR